MVIFCPETIQGEDITVSVTPGGKPESGGLEEAPRPGPYCNVWARGSEHSLVLARKTSLELWLFSHVLQMDSAHQNGKLKSFTEFAFNVKNKRKKAS